MESEFQFYPSEGELRPLETKEIRVRFCPQQCRSLRTLFDVNVIDGNERFVFYYKSCYFIQDTDLIT